MGFLKATSKPETILGVYKDKRKSAKENRLMIYSAEKSPALNVPTESERRICEIFRLRVKKTKNT